MLSWQNPHMALPDVVNLAHLLAQVSESGDIFALQGDLGTGKTTFARAFIQAQTSNEQDVPSPTFTLVQIYESSKGPIYHYDLYRLKTATEVFELGIEDAFSGGICLIEWPERIEEYLPENTLNIEFLSPTQEYQSQRSLKITGNALWNTRLNLLSQIL